MIRHFSNILVHFVFCQLNFIVLFPFFIKYYHILFIVIVFWLGCDRPSGLLFFRARFAFFHTQASLLTSFVCFFILFHYCCSHAQVFGKTLVHELPISYSHTEWYLHFFRSVKAMNNWKRSAIKQILLLLPVVHYQDYLSTFSGLPDLHFQDYLSYFYIITCRTFTPFHVVHLHHYLSYIYTITCRKFTPLPVVHLHDYMSYIYTITCPAFTPLPAVHLHHYL